MNPTPAAAALAALLPAQLAALATVARAGNPDFSDPVNAVPAPPHASGYPSRDANLDALPGFRSPPPGYGEVPYWWWTGDPLDVDRLIWQFDQLHQKGISGVQVNYAHEDSSGWPTYAVEPPIFSEAWWKVWGRIADECRKRGMGIGLSTYTLDWTGADNLFRQLFYRKPELNALRLSPANRHHLSAGKSATVDVPDDLVAAIAYRVNAGLVQEGGVDLTPNVRDGKLTWTAPDGEWEIWLFRADRQANTLNPLQAGIGEIVIRDFYQRFQDATPNKSHEGLNYFFNDELHVGAGTHVWNADFAAEFQKRKGYDLFTVLPALWSDIGPTTPKVRVEYVRSYLPKDANAQHPDGEVAFAYEIPASRPAATACMHMEIERNTVSPARLPDRSSRSGTIAFVSAPLSACERMKSCPRAGCGKSARPACLPAGRFDERDVETEQWIGLRHRQ